MTYRDALKGLGIVLSLVFGPFVLGLVLTPMALSLGINHLANLAFGFVLLWSFLLLPHLGITPQPVPITGWLVFVIPLTQWSIVGLLVSRLTVGSRMLRVLTISVASVTVVGVLAHVVIRALGLTVIFEGP